LFQLQICLPMLGAFLTTILFSLSAVSGRRLSNYLSGTQANLIRLLLAAAMLGAWSHLFGFGIAGKAFPILFLSGCVGFGMGDLAMFQAFPRIGTRRTSVMILCLSVPIAALTEWAWLGVAPTLAQAGYGVLILIGVVIAIMPGRAEAQPAHGLAVGIFFGTLAAIGQAGGAVLSRKAYAVAAATGQTFHGVGDGVNAAYQRMLGGIVVSALVFAYLKLVHNPDATRRANWLAAWPWIGANSLAGPTLGVTCFQWALMAAPTKIVLPIVATTPLVVIPLAWKIEGEHITKRAVIGGIFAVGGVIGLTMAR
jgi:drug/metabolite transporter (DMT)-like permease